MAVARCHGTFSDVVALCRHLGPSVLLVDQGFLRAERIGVDVHRKLGTSVRVLLEFEDGQQHALETLLQLGCWGFVRPSAPAKTVARAVTAVASGQLWVSRSDLTMIVRSVIVARLFSLTARETEILRLVALGYRNQEIARRLFISNETVRWHLRCIYSKLGVHDRFGAALGAFGSFQPGAASVTHVPPREFRTNRCDFHQSQLEL